jgi:fluoroquinolone transport system ATP-binding protein
MPAYALPAIAVERLSFRYPRANADTLRDLSFNVAGAEIFGFLGPSGAGKSTTQRILTGLQRGHEGSVRVLGEAPGGADRSWYRRIGVSFEVPNVYGRLTGRENLDFFASLYDGPTRAADELLALVGLEAAADERAINYSRGMRMRLNFCRALLCSPELLFLDEPTSGQDPDNARRIKDIIRDQRAAGCTVFLTTHDMATAAELCDRVAFLVAGRIVMIDAPRTLMVRHGERRLRVEYHENGTGGTAYFDVDGLARNAEFLRLLETVRIDSMHTLDATLEDVFVAVTGARLT